MPRTTISLVKQRNYVGDPISAINNSQSNVTSTLININKESINDNSNLLKADINYNSSLINNLNNNLKIFDQKFSDLQKKVQNAFEFS